MPHRLRTAMVRPGRNRLSGVVEVDETFFGGLRPGKRGRRTTGKALVAVVVEEHEPKGFGRCRLRVIPNAKAVALDLFLFLRDFLEQCVQVGGPSPTSRWSSIPRRRASHLCPRRQPGAGDTPHMLGGAERVDR